MRSIYQIAVELTMVNHAGGVLSTLAHSLVGIHHHINAATAASNRFRTALVAAGAALVSGGLLAGMAQLVDRGAEFNRILNQMRLSGWSESMLTGSGSPGHPTASARAFELSRLYPTLTPTQVMEMMREMAPVLGSREEALHVSDLMSRLMVSLQHQFGSERATELHRQIRDAVRAGELSGNSLTHERFGQFVNLMARSLQAFGGTVTPHDYMQAIRYSRAAGLNWSDEFMGQILPTIMQELGSSSTGTAFMSMYQALMGGQMTVRAINAWDALGLVDRSRLDPTNLTPEGRIRRLSPNSIIGSYDFMSNPYRWMQETLMPAFLRQGIITQAGLDQIRAGNLREGLGLETMRAITAQMAIMFGNRTAQGMADILALQPRRIERDMALVPEAAGIGPEAIRRILGDYSMARSGVGAQWAALNTALALPNMETATSGLQMLSGALGSLTTAVRGMDPGTVRAIFIGVGSALVGLVTLAVGSLLIALMGLPVLIGVAIFGAIAGIGAYIYSKWGQISGWLQEQWRSVLFNVEHYRSMIVHWARSIASKIGEALASIPGLVSVSEMVQAIASKITAGLASIGAWIGSFLPGGRPGGNSMPDIPGFTPLPAPGTPGGLMQRQSWVPPSSRSTLVPVNHVLTIDGHRIAEAVSHYIAVGATHVQAAAQYDGSMGHVPVDIQMA